MYEPVEFNSRHFTVHSLADGVFAAIAKDGGWAICNSALIDLGGRSLIFDSFLTPQASMDLRRFATDIRAGGPDIVVNSHHHNDHIWGNQVFSSDAQLISSSRTRELIATDGMAELNWYASNSAQRLASLQAELPDVTDDLQLHQQMICISEYEGIIDALPDLEVCIPNITFSHGLAIYGAKRSVELIAFEDGHTGSDTILYLSKDGVVLMGDLLFVGFHPWLGDGDPFGLLKALEESRRLNATWYVPGHGPVGTVKDVGLLISYVEQCLETAEMLVERGDRSEDRIKDLKIPEPFQAWGMPRFYGANIGFLCERLESAHSDKQVPS
jgi:glyoxylase-like metal-dependent hydrolase (beta-lactamase superfamily II)